MKTQSERNAEQILEALKAFHKKHPEATPEQTLKFHLTLMEGSSRVPSNMSGEQFATVLEEIEAKTLARCDYYNVPRQSVAISLTEGTEGFWLRQDGDKFAIVYRGIPSNVYIDDAVKRVHDIMKLPLLTGKGSIAKKIVEFSQETGKVFKKVNLEVEENEFFELLPENSFEVKCSIEYKVTHKKTGECVTITRDKQIEKSDSHILFAAMHQISQNIYGKEE